MRTTLNQIGAVAQACLLRVMGLVASGSRSGMELVSWHHIFAQSPVESLLVRPQPTDRALLTPMTHRFKQRSPRLDTKYMHSSMFVGNPVYTHPRNASPK